MSSSSRFLPVAEAQPPIFAGVDVGGTSIKIGIVDDLGRTLGWTSIPTDAAAGPDDATRRTAAATLKLLTQLKLSAKQIVRVGLGTPGTMDIPAGMLLDPPNLPGWIDFPIRDRQAALLA